MRRVRGIGGIFFKSENPEALRAWYAKHLGIVSEGEHGTMFRWAQADSPSKENFTAWCIFPASTTYFGKGNASLMVNYVVDDLHALLDVMRKEGVWVDPKVEEYDYGNLAGSWIPMGTGSSFGSLCQRKNKDSIQTLQIKNAKFRLAPCLTAGPARADFPAKNLVR